MTDTPSALAINVAHMIRDALAKLNAEAREASDLYTIACRNYCDELHATPPADDATLAALKSAAAAAKLAAENVELRNDHDRFAALVIRLPAWVAEISTCFPAIRRGHRPINRRKRCQSELWDKMTVEELATIDLILRPSATVLAAHAAATKPRKIPEIIDGVTYYVNRDDLSTGRDIYVKKSATESGKTRYTHVGRFDCNGCDIRLYDHPSSESESE